MQMIRRRVGISAIAADRARFHGAIFVIISLAMSGSSALAVNPIASGGTVAGGPVLPAYPFYADTAAVPATAPATVPAAVGESPFQANVFGDFLGHRQPLQDAGVTLGGTLQLEGFDNLQGGLDTAHLLGSTTLDLNLALDTQKLFNLRGGEFYIDLEDHAFRNPSTQLVGDLQVFDKQNASPYLQICEAWYQQRLFDGKFRVKVGKIDENSEFSVIDNGLSFINGSTQANPTIFMMPTTPDPMPAIDAFFTPNDFYYASVGISYANRSDRFGDLVGDPASIQPAQSGFFFIGETGLKWTSDPWLGLDGNFKLGAWADTGKFQRFDGGQRQNAYGGYGILDQTFWQPAGEPIGGRGVRGFLNFGQTQDHVNPIDRNLGGGITWTGPLQSRPADIIGVSPQYAHIPPDAGLRHPYELAIEGFYQWQLTPWAFVQPDLQYIVHPGGAYHDALVASLRVQITF
jgi:porin